MSEVLTPSGLIVVLSDTLDRAASVPQVASAELVDNGTNLVRRRSFAGSTTSIAPGLLAGAALALINNGTNVSPAWSSGATADGTGNSGNGMLAASQHVYDGAGNYLRRRMPTTFKTATATASGDTAVWTPAAGKKFRLQRYSIQITADAATAGGADIDVILRDATTGLAAAFTSFVPAVAGTAFGNTNQTGWCDLGNGILSAAANNVLNVNLSAALTAGKVRVVVAGTEE